MLEMICDPNRIRMSEVAEMVCRHFVLDHEEVFSLSRKRKFIRPRQIFMLLARELTGETLEAIGKFCERNHASVINSLSTVKEQIEVDPVLAHIMRGIRSELMDTWESRHDRSQLDCTRCVNQDAYPPACVGHPVAGLKCEFFLKKTRGNGKQR